MDNQELDAITAFDTLYTTNHLQMLKILLPYLQREMQPHIAVYIKLSEFLFALRFSKESDSSCDSCCAKPQADIQSIMCEISPYLNGNEKEMLQKLSDLKNNMDQFKQISQMMQMMEKGADSPESMLQGFLSEEQLAMFKMFQEDLS